MPMNFFMNGRTADEARLAFYGVAAVFAGFAGGLLGAGAGLFLFMICRRTVGGKAAHVSALCATLPTAVLSAALYVRGSPQTLFEALPLLPFAAAGGALGAYLMSRLRVRALGYITAALAVTGGVIMTVR